MFLPSQVPSIRSLGVAKSVKWADEEGERLEHSQDHVKWINAPQMVDGERLIDDYHFHDAALDTFNNNDLYDLDVNFPTSLLGLSKVHPEHQPLTENRRDFRDRESFQMGCLEYTVLAVWGVFLLLAGGYMSWRVVSKGGGT